MELRKKYPFFVFQSYHYKRTKNSLKAEFSFSLADEIFFHPTIEVPVRTIYDFDSLEKSTIDLLVFHIGMVELISYWKTACPPRLMIQPHQLDEEQIRWWKKLYFHGLGEFFYLNGIDISQDDFMSISSAGTASQLSKLPLSGNKILVPIGGGKDSIVTMELLKNSNLKVIPFILNPREASLRTIEIGGYEAEKSVIVNRNLDNKLLELNEKGFLNGHTPFSALLAFVSSLTALASGAKYIALSNENSANESTVPGSKINHQYSKSLEFEKDFDWYIRHYIHPDLYYFSFLRPLNELQIAFLFSQYPRHFLSFRSCNVGSKTDGWCGHCPKCLFTYIILSPFIPTKTMELIFHKNLLDDLHLFPILKALDGTVEVKPFECVGTPHEVNVALWKTEQLIREAKLPELLKGKEMKNGLEAVEFDKLLVDRSAEHRVPDKFYKFIDTAFDKVIKVNHASISEGTTDMVNHLKKIFQQLPKVLILGFGREGRSTYRFLKQYFPDLQIGIADRTEKLADEKDIQATFHLGANYLSSIDQYDWVIKSPGVLLPSVSEEQLRKISSQTDLFLHVYGKQTVGITGTKGKSTTSSLICHLLQHSGRKALLMGNIGLPAFDFIEKIDSDTIVVYELSAHQLQYVHNSPHIGLLLNIYPEHLDFFGDICHYQDAKQNIFRYQTHKDIALCGQDLPEINHVHLGETKQETMKIFGKTISPENLLQLSGLKGQHNLQNVLMASKAVKFLGLNADEILMALPGFKALPHRLEFVGNYGGISFYNDSIATIPQATIAAVNSLENIDTLILGGFDRGIDYSGLIDFLENSPISYFFFLGKAGKRMLELFKEKNTSQHLILVKEMEEIFQQLKTTADIHSCLLSPAAASYDQFHNFEHRGDRFKELAKELERTK